MTTVLLKNAGAFFLSGTLTRLFPLFLIPVLTRFLQPSEYGVIAIYQVLMTFAVAAFGLNINVNVTKAYFSQTGPAFGSVLISMLLILFSAMCVFTVIIEVSLLFGLMSSFLIEESWLRLLPIITFMTMLNLVYLGYLKSTQQVFRYAVFELSRSCFSFITIVFLLVTLSMQTRAWLIGVTVSCVGWGLYSLWRLYPLCDGNEFPNSHVIAKLVATSAPLVPHTLATAVIVASDRFFLEFFRDAETVGIYSIAYLLGMAVLMLSDSFIKAWSPWFYSMIQKENLEADYLIVRYSLIYMCALFFLALLIAIVAELCLPFIVDSRYLSAGPIIIWIALAHVAFGFYQIFFPYLVQYEKTTVLAVTSIIAASLNGALNFFLIPQYGMTGAAASTLAAYLASFLFVALFCQRIRPMPWLSCLHRTHII